MADFTVNVTKVGGRAAIISTNPEAAAWMLRNELSVMALGKSRLVAYVDETQVEAIQEALSAEGFSVEVKIT